MRTSTALAAALLATTAAALLVTAAPADPVDELAAHRAAYDRFSVAADPTQPPAAQYAAALRQGPDRLSAYVVVYPADAFSDIAEFSAFTLAYDSTFPFIACSGSRTGIRFWLTGPSAPPSQLFGEPASFDGTELAAFELEPWVAELQWGEARRHSMPSDDFAVIGSTSAGWTWAAVQYDGFDRLNCTAGGTLAGAPPRAPVAIGTARRDIDQGHAVANRYALEEFESPTAFATQIGAGGEDPQAFARGLVLPHQAPFSVWRAARSVADPLAGTRWANGVVHLGPDGWDAFYVYQDAGGWVHVRFRSNPTGE